MVQQKVEEKTPWAWYLLPMLLGIVGGVLGYFLLKNKDEATAKSLIWAGVAYTVGYLIGLFTEIPY